MSCLSVNLRGAGGSYKGDWVRDLKMLHQINFISVQETQLIDTNDLPVNLFLGNSDFHYVSVESQGRSGGLFSNWNPHVFQRLNVIKNSN